MRPTRRAIALAAGGQLVALLPAVVSLRLWPFWPVSLAVFVLLLAADALLAPRRAGVSVLAAVPETLHIGEGGEARLTVRVLSERALNVLIALDLSDRLMPQPPQRVRIGPEGTEIAFRLLPTRRGPVTVERAWIRYEGPLGLLAAVITIDIGREAAVVPNLGPVHRAALRFAGDRAFRAGLRIERYTGDGTELDSLREHVQGDDTRSIDWKSTARHKKLVTRQFRAERDRQIIISLDTGRLMSEPAAGIPKIDHAITAALLLSYISLRAGDRVGWITFDARVGPFVEPLAGLHNFRALAQAAGRINESSQETNFTLGLTSLARRLTRRSLVVVLTDFDHTVTAELMVESLERLAHRHAVVFVALQNPRLAAIADLSPASPLDVNRAIVAGTLLRDREIVLQRLRLQGIRPIDAVPGEVMPRLIDSYLEIKRRERI